MALDSESSYPFNTVFNLSIHFEHKIFVFCSQLKKVGIPHQVVDVWEYCGSRKEAQYTWDMRRNDNLEMNCKFRPRCRFDRLFFRPDAAKSVKPVYFELVGLSRLTTCRRFPSDHWGLLSHYDIRK